MNHAQTMEVLSFYNACDDAQIWVKQNKLASQLWAKCNNGSWMLWIAGRVGIDRRLLVRAACACARESLKYVPAGEDRPRICIETTERWTRGQATIEEVRQAKYSARSDAAAAAAAARNKSFEHSAKLVREHITHAMIAAAIKGKK